MRRSLRTRSELLGALALAVATIVVVPGGSAGATAATGTTGAAAAFAEPPRVIADPEVKSVPEGTGATFTIRLSQAPPRTDFLGIRIQGTGTWASPPVMLVFTPTNWNTPQSYSVMSVPDADAVDDVAAFTLTFAGYEADKVVLTQIDDD